MYVDEPSTGVYYGSLVAAPYVGEIFKQIAAYKKFPFDVKYENGTGNIIVPVPAVTGLPVVDAVTKLEQAGLFVEVDGDGDKVTGSFPVVGTLIKKGEPVVLFT